MGRARSPAAMLVRALADSSQAAWLLDESRVIIWCNAACELWFNASAAELVGRQCDYQSAGQGRMAAALAGLCPPPETAAGVWTSASVADAQGRSAEVVFAPLASAEPGYVLGLQVDPAGRELVRRLAVDLEAAAALHRQLSDWRREQAQRFSIGRLAGRSPQAVRLRKQIEIAANCRAALAIVGPRGSGLFDLARTVHYGATSPGKLVPLECAALDAHALRAALPGLAPPKATTRDFATLVLIDAERCPVQVQDEIVRLAAAAGDEVRLIGLFSESPTELVARGEFNAELAMLLSTLTIQAPALAARLDDLPQAAQALLEDLNAAGDKQLSGFMSDALDLMALYAWPGDLDELKAAVQAMHAAAAGPLVAARDVPRTLHASADALRHPRRALAPIDLEAFLAGVERRLIEQALAEAKQNKTQAAYLLGMTRPRFYRRLVQLGLAEPPANGKEPMDGIDVIEEIEFQEEP